jgi:hypothetical protein
MAGNMESLGPNPEVMFGSLVDGLARKIADDPNISPAEKAKQTKALKLDGGALRHALDISTGMISRPVNSMGAKIGGDIRAVESMAKLGGCAVLLGHGPGDECRCLTVSRLRLPQWVPCPSQWYSERSAER